MAEKAWVVVSSQERLSVAEDRRELSGLRILAQSDETVVEIDET